MNSLYIEPGAVRAQAERLHSKLENEYGPRLDAIVAKLGGNADEPPMGRTGSEYHGRELGAVILQCGQERAEWSAALRSSMLDMATALAVASETLTEADAEGADEVVSAHQFDQPPVDHGDHTPALP